jgi:hypothetical protein
MQQITAGQSTEMNLYGPDTQTGEQGARVLHVVIHHFGSFISLLFTDHAVLNRQLPIAEARAYLRDIKREAKAGTALWAIEAQAGVLTSTSAIVNQAEEAMVEGIRANMDAAQPKPVDVSDIVPQGAGSWQALRQANRRDFSRTRVSSQEPTEAELGRIRAARRNNDGTLTVTRAPGQSWTVLKALRDRLGGVPTYKPGTARVIDALTFPAEQLSGYLTEVAA